MKSTALPAVGQSPAKPLVDPNVSHDTLVHLPVDTITPNPDQPREDFGDLDGLADTIQEHGLQQPITVSDNGDGTYTLIAGGRRLMAAKLAKQTTIPAIIKTGDRAVLALLENVQRQDLRPLEEARAFRKMIDAGETQQSLAKKLGVGRTYIAQKVRLLNLPSEARLLLERVTASTAEAMEQDNKEGAALFHPITEAAARQILRLTILDKLATNPPVRESWANHYAHRILWHQCARSAAEIQYRVDQVFAEAVFAKRYRNRDDEAEGWSILWPGMLMHQLLKPDYSRLSKAQDREIFKSFLRWVNEHQRRHTEAPEQ